jgi:hypothetical protein
MKKISITTDVVNGMIKRNRNLVTEAIQSFEGKTIILTIERQTKKRSLEQNRYYWGVLIEIAKKGIYECWGECWDSNSVHNLLLNECPVYRDIVYVKTGEVKSVKKTSSEMTTIEMSLYWDKCIKYLAENFYMDCPLPDEKLTLNFD